MILEFAEHFDQIVPGDSGYAECFTQTQGTPLEMQLQMELCATVKTSARLLEENSDDLQVQSITPIIHRYAAVAANTDNKAVAFHIADFCLGMTDLSEKLKDLCNESLAGKMGKAVAEGVYRSAENYVTYAFHNPQDVAIDIALGAICPPAVAVRRIGMLARDVYQNRKELCGVAQQFWTDIQNERYRDDEWLENNVTNFTKVTCDFFVTPRIAGRTVDKLKNKQYLANSFERQIVSLKIY